MVSPVKIGLFFVSQKIYKENSVYMYQIKCCSHMHNNKAKQNSCISNIHIRDTRILFNLTNCADIQSNVFYQTNMIFWYIHISSYAKFLFTVDKVSFGKVKIRVN